MKRKRKIIHFVGRRQSEDIPGNIHQYVTGMDERSQHRHILSEKRLRKIIQSVARRRSEDIPGSIHKYVTGVDEQSQHRHRLKDEA